MMLSLLAGATAALKPPLMRSRFGTLFRAVFCGDMSDKTVNEKMELLFDCNLDDFLEKPNRLPNLDNVEPSLIANDNKTVLWNDPTTGFYDKHILKGTNEFLTNTAKELKEIYERISCILVKRKE